MATELIEQEPASVVPQPATKAPLAKEAAKKKPRAKKAAPKKAVAKKATKKPVVKKPATKSARKKRASKKPPANRHAAKKPVAKKPVAKKPASKKRKVKKQVAVTNKAQSIRDMATQLGKKSRPRHIIAALADKGITVVSAQVSTVLKAAGMRRGRRRRKVAMAIAAQQTSRNGKSQTFNVDHLIQVRELAAKLGGIEKLKETVAALEKLQSIWLGV